MLAWIAQNIGTIIICAVLALIVGAVIISMIRKKRKGKSVVCNCGNCSSCPMSGQCHSK